MDTVNVLAPFDWLGRLARSRMGLALFKHEGDVVVLDEPTGEPRVSVVHAVYGYTSQKQLIQHRSLFACEHVADSSLGQDHYVWAVFSAVDRWAVIGKIHQPPHRTNPRHQRGRISR